MARTPLSNTGEWELKFDEQDVRGFDALDAEGNRIGTVDAMIVNTDEERVDAVVLEDGTEYPAREVSIGDGVVYLTGAVPNQAAEGVTVYDDYGHVVRRERVEGDADAHAEAFRRHYDEALASSGEAYGTYEPAYRYGYDMARDDRFRDRDYDAAATDLESGYTRRFPDSPYGTVRDAVRFGYMRARRD